MFLVNSRLGLFSAASSCVNTMRHPFSRSYGVILPSSLTTVLSLALGFSPHPPVSVCGTGTFYLARSFSRQREINDFATKFRSPSHPRIVTADLPTATSSMLGRTIPTVRSPILLCHSITQTIIGGTGIYTCCPSPTPFGLGLGPD